MARRAIRWHKQGRGIVSSVTPGSPVRLWIDGPVAADSLVDVFQIAEVAISRALRKLFRRSPGTFVTNLPVNPNAVVPTGSGVLTEDWLAAQRLGKSLRASRYVGRLPGEGASGPLEVFAETSVTTNSSSPSLRLDASMLAGATGLPLPSVLAQTGERKTTLAAIVKAAVDPDVQLRVLTPSSPELDLDTYLQEVAEVFDVRGDDLFEAFREVNADWLIEPLDIETGTGRPTHIEAGHSIPLTVDLYPSEPGSTMLALAVVDTASEQVLGISEMVGLTVDEYGLIFRDF